MAPYLGAEFGNPSGAHASSRRALRALDDARDMLAEVLGCEPGEVVFTSGGTEADNLAVTGSAIGAMAAGGDAPLVCCSAVEHPAVLETVRFLGGLELPVDSAGVLDLATLRSVLDVEQDRVALVSVMLANNETGTLEPVAEVAELVRDLVPSALVHCDAVQGLGWLDVATETRAVDLVSVSAHKIGGPKGVGALVVRGDADRRLAPILRGGPQEHALRAGTPNLPGIVGFALAAEATRGDRGEQAVRVAELGGRLLAGLLSAVPDAVLAVEGAERLGAIVNVGFPGVEAEELLIALDQKAVAASAGSACASGALDPSPVLVAMGRDEATARTHVRFSLGWTTTAMEVDEAAAIIGHTVAQLRAAP